MMQPKSFLLVAMSWMTLLPAVASDALAQDLILAPCCANGIYDVGERVSRIIALPQRATTPAGLRTSTIRENNFGYPLEISTLDLASGSTGSAQATPAPAADQPIPRTDQNSRLAHEQLLEKARKGGIDVYFEGDSITRRWGALDYPQFLANWTQNFLGWNAADFGWGGDTVQNILWRLNNGELDNVHPKIIVVLAGANNVGNRPSAGDDDPRIGEVTTGIQAVLSICREKAPGATIILVGIFPRNDNAGNPVGVMPVIDRINENLARFADGKRIRYLNINDRLADNDGKLRDGMTADKLHLTLTGYQVWADALKPIFTELLGPPAKEDHAPPPTGDPSAASKPAAAG